MKIFWRFLFTAFSSSALISGGWASTNDSADAKNPCSSTSPRYSDASRRNGEYGTVVMRVLVDAGGTANRAEVVQSTGHTRLDQAAIAWIMSCSFTPWTVDASHPQTLSREIRFNFEPSR